MARPNIKRRHTDLQLESILRLSSFPIVESGIYIAGNVYEKIKRSNSLMEWGFDTAEQSFAKATASAMPVMFALNTPIMTIDHLLCKGIDIVEQRVPAVHLPPHLMYWNTREYVNNKFVKPVLIRADSVKLIGSQAANAAVERLAGAINAADQYVDRYLPADPADKIAETCTDSANNDETANKAVRTIEHGARFSRKLQRRLTRRTLAEARALKEQGTECMHVLLYVIELLATDPKLAMQKAIELWASLSLPEPENQARPTNLEQLLVLFTRETARRIVHLVNGSANLAAKAPRRLARALIRISHQLIHISENVLKVTYESLNRQLFGAIMIIMSLRHHDSTATGTTYRTKPKIHFQTNGDCHNAGCATVGNGGSDSSASKCLSLIAKINIVSLSRADTKSSSSLSSHIKELPSGDNNDDDGVERLRRLRITEVEGNGASETPIVNTTSKKNREVMRQVIDKSRKLPIKNSFAFNRETILPSKTNQRVEKKIPLLYPKFEPIIFSKKK